MKKVFALALVAFAVIGFMTAPSFAEALSDEQQNSLEMLLRSFGADDSTIRNFQGAVLGATTGPTDDYGTDGTSTSGIYCPKLTSTLQRGARDATTGGQVTELQLFLADYFNLNEEDIASGFFGRLSQSYVVKFQQEKGLPAFGIAGSLTRAKIAESCGKGQTGTTGLTPTVTTVTPTTPTTPSTNTNSNNSSNYNVGTIPVRAIVANIDEAGTKFTQSKLSEVGQALERLNAFVQQSSYGKAKLRWSTSGVYELGGGVCTRASYGDKVEDLIQRALQAADKESPLADYSFYVIVHPMPNCPDGVQWSFEGKGQFTAYALNGRTVHLRGIHISDLSDQYLFHEFGHSLAYQPNTGIGHPDYMNCPVTSSGGVITIPISTSCPRVFDFYNGILPVFTLMSKLSTLSDFSAIEKEIAGWLTASDIVTTTSGEYTLSPLEQIGTAPKALKIPVAGTNYNVYVSFRLPTASTKPSGVILDISNGSAASFLVTNNANMDAPLQIGVPYRIGANGPYVRVTSIAGNRASITVSATATTPTTPTTPSVNLGCVPTAPPAGYALDSFYKKFCLVEGIPLVSSAAVSDTALKEAGIMMQEMLKGRSDIVGKLIQNKVKVAVIGANEVTTDIPEYRNLPKLFPGTDWNGATRGVGATITIPVSSVGEENLNCLSSDRYTGQSIFVHEFGHTIKDLGVNFIDTSFQGRLENVFRSARAAGLWSNTYAGTNSEEYWATGVQAYFDAGGSASPTNGIYNSINTQSELRAYDPTLYALVNEVFKTSWKWKCNLSQSGTGTDGPTTANGLSYSIVLKGGNGTASDSFVEGSDIGPFQIVIKNNARTSQTVVFPNNCWYTYRIYDKDNGGRMVFDLSAVQQCVSAASQVPTTFTLNPGESVQIDMTHRYQTYHIPPGNYSMTFDINSRNPQRNAVKFDFKVVGKVAPTSNLYCSLATDKSAYVLGETITVKWNSNGTYGQWVKDTERDNFYLGGDKIAASGKTTFTANILGNPYLVLRVYDASGGTSTCRLVIPVSSVGTASPTISITSAGHVDADAATQFTVEYGNMPSSGVNVVNVNTGATVWTQELTSGGNGSLTLIVRPAVSPGEYIVQAFNSSRTVIATSARYTVGSVTPVPVVAIQITPSTISVGGSSTLTWTTQNANRCYMSYGSIQESVPLSGTWTINNTVTTKYTLRCVNDPGTGKDGPASEASATLTVSNTSSVGELYAVGVYEAQGAQHNFCYSKPGTVNVNLVQLVGTKKGTPITLSLSAYEPVIWNINVPAGVNLQKVILSGYNVQSPVITGASPLVERYFYNDPANAARGISPAGSFYDERDGADSRFQTIYNWAGQATCANTSGAVPIASRWYYNPGSNYFYAYQKTDSNYSTLVSKLQSMTGLTLKNFQGAYSGSTFTVTVGTPEY